MLDANPLAERLNFINMNTTALARLRGIKTVIRQALPTALKAFYAKAGAEPKTAVFFSSQEMIKNAEARQIAHWSTITEGDFRPEISGGGDKSG